MSSQEEHNKLTDEKKFKLIEFYKENSELWVTQGITRSQKALKEELVKDIFNRDPGKRFSCIKIRASFLREHKKYQKEGKLPNKGLEILRKHAFFEKRAKDQ